MQRQEERLERSRRGDVENGGGGGWEREGDLEDWGQASVLDRLKYDLSRERRSSQLAWIRSRLVKLQQHVAECSQPK